MKSIIDELSDDIKSKPYVDKLKSKLRKLENASRKIPTSRRDDER